MICITIFTEGLTTIDTLTWYLSLVSKEINSMFRIKETAETWEWKIIDNCNMPFSDDLFYINVFSL